MTRLRALVESICGADARQRIFDPLVADWQRDLQEHAPASLSMRVRWWAAIVMTIGRALWSTAFGRLSRSLALDLAARALAFGTLAFELQWFLGARLGPQSGAQAWPPSFATTVPFVIIPVMWRLRAAGIPRHQQRLFTFTLTIVSVAGTWIATPANFSLRIASMFALILLAVGGWRLATLNLSGELAFGRWMTGFYTAAMLILASMPVKLALGISLWRPWWPGDNLIPYIVGVMVALTISPRTNAATA